MCRGPVHLASEGKETWIVCGTCGEVLVYGLEPVAAVILDMFPVPPKDDPP